MALADGLLFLVKYLLIVKPALGSVLGRKCTFSISFMDQSQILLKFSIVNYYHADEILIFLFLSNKLRVFLKFHL